MPPVSALAGMTAGIRIESLLFLPGFAFNMTASILVGHELGAGRPDEAKGEVPEIKGLTWVDNLQAYIERKLFTVNTGHASIAYLAYQKGIKDIYSAMQDPEIVAFVRKVWGETGSMLVEKYGFDPAAHQKYVETTEKRFANPHLSDEVTRVARGPKRKLGAKDRLVSPATQLIAQGKTPTALAKVIAAALHFDYEGDKEAVEVQAYVKEHGYEEALTHFTGIEKGSKLYDLVDAELKAYEK